MLRHGWVVGISIGLLAGAAGSQALAQQVAELDVIPSSVTVATGERKEVLAVAYGPRGDVLADAKFDWATSDAGVVRVELDPTAPPGVAYLLGVAQGGATVTVKVRDQQRTIAVQVSGAAVAGPQGTGPATVLKIEPAQVAVFPTEDIQLRPVFLKDDGSLAAYQQVTWRSIRPEVAEVDQNGRLLGVSPGPGVVEATAAGGRLSARIQVQVGTIEWSFTRPAYALSPLASDTVRIMVPGQGNRVLESRYFDWQSTDRNVVTVSPLGVLTAINAGKAEIVVRGFGQESRAPVSVHRQVEGLRIAPARGTILVPLGGTRRFKAIPEAADSTAIPDAPVYWVIADSSVLGYDVRDTLATGRKIGRTTLTARAPGNWEATWTVDVVAAGLALDRTRFGIGLRDQATLRASFADSTGVPLGTATDVRWSSSDEAVLQVSSDGQVVPVGYGYAAVVAATPWGVADTALVFVQGEILVTSTQTGKGDIYAFERDRPDEIHRVSGDSALEVAAAYSPDGSQIVYATNQNGNFDIHVMDADGANSRRITTSPANENEPAWTPDGKQIVYQSDAGGRVQVWIMNADGANARQLTQGEASFDPAVSPDGSTIAFTGFRNKTYDVYLMGLDGSNVRNFTNTAAPVHERMPAWVGDSAIFFIKEARAGRTATWVIARQTIAGGTAEAMTEPGLVVTDFAVSPRGELLAIGAEASLGRKKVQRVFLVPLNGNPAAEVAREQQDQLVRPAFRP